MQWPWLCVFVSYTVAIFDAAFWPIISVCMFTLHTCASAYVCVSACITSNTLK